MLPFIFSMGCGYLTATIFSMIYSDFSDMYYDEYCDEYRNKRNKRNKCPVEINWPVAPPGLKIYEREDCVICSEKLSHELVTLICGHQFCKNCITTWAIGKRGNIKVNCKCPMCRDIISFDIIDESHNIYSYSYT